MGNAPLRIWDSLWGEDEDSATSQRLGWGLRPEGVGEHSVVPPETESGARGHGTEAGNRPFVVIWHPCQGRQKHVLVGEWEEGQMGGPVVLCLKAWGFVLRQPRTCPGDRGHAGGLQGDFSPAQTGGMARVPGQHDTGSKGVEQPGPMVGCRMEACGSGTCRDIRGAGAAKEDSTEWTCLCCDPRPQSFSHREETGEPDDIPSFFSSLHHLCSVRANTAT